MAKDGQADFAKTVGLRIKHLRISKKITQRQLAYGCNMEPASISKIETGKTNVKLNTLKAICDFMQVPLASVFEQSRT